jgi:hypothetical protein
MGMEGSVDLKMRPLAVSRASRIALIDAVATATSLFALRVGMGIELCVFKTSNARHGKRAEY